MSEKIDATLKKIAAGTPTGKTEPPPEPNRALAGDPNCPHCGGLGYLRQDLPVGHPDFGKLLICSCRNQDVRQQVHDRLFAMSNLEQLRHLTFENFQPRGRFGVFPAQADSIEWAYNQSRQFAQKLSGWLLLQGDYGCGKTHLAAAIANFTVSIGVPTLFLTVPDLLDKLRFAYDDPEATFEERFEEIRSAPLLVMDDFGTQNATGWAREKLFQILNYRYINHLPLVVTTNLSLSEVDERIRSRLTDPELVTRVRILAPDYRDPTKDEGHHSLSSLELLVKCTFETFEARKNEGLGPSDLQSLEKALAQARDFARRPKGWLIFTGPYGCGKTHLAAAIAWARLSAEKLTSRDQDEVSARHEALSTPLIFVVAPDLFDYLRATFNAQSNVALDRRFEEIRTTPLLILDDLGTQTMTPWVREKLYQLLNYRYNAELPTVITTPELKDQMDPRIASRLTDARLCTICAITAPSYRGLPHKTPRPRKK